MTWKLKDKQFLQQLDKISNGDFSRQLKNNGIDIVSSDIDLNLRYRVCFGQIPDAIANRFSVVFREDELENVPDYQAGCWNHWPETEPEECVLMEIREDGNDETHGFNFFLDGIWYHSMGCTCSELSNKEFRYRPAKLFFEERRRNGRN